MKKKSPGRTLLIVLLVIVLLLAGIAAAIFFSVKSKLDKEVMHLDNVPAILAEEPASFAERAVFNEDGRVTFRVYKNDVWWILSRMYGADLEEALAQQLSQSGIAYKGMGLNFDGDGAVVDLEAQWSSIRLPLHIYLDLTCEDGQIAVRPERVEIGGKEFGVKELAGRFGYDADALALVYVPESSLLKEIEKIEIGENTISFIGPLETASVGKIKISEERNAVMGLSQEAYADISSVLFDYDPDPALCYASTLPAWSADAASYIDFLEQLYPFLTEAQIRNHVDTEANYGFAERWYQKPDPSVYKQKGDAIYDEYYVNYRFIHSILDELDAAYRAKRVRVGTDFDAEKLYGDQYAYYDDAVPLGEAVLCGVDAEHASGCGLLVRGKDKRPYLLYSSMAGDARIYNVIPLDEAEAEELRTAETPVWTKE